MACRKWLGMADTVTSSLSKRTQSIGLAAWLVVSFAAAGLGSIVTATSADSWYQTLARPSWNPPDWVFGPVWTTLFAMMAVAAWLIWRQAGLRQAARCHWVSS